MKLTFQGTLRTTADPDEIANLLRKGWVETQAPSYDAATHHAPTWKAGQWVAGDPLPPSPAKQWPSKTEFWAEFTQPEKAAIILATNTGIRLLYAELTMWQEAVHADDVRIVGGLAALVSAGILSPERSAEIAGE